MSTAMNAAKGLGMVMDFARKPSRPQIMALVKRALSTSSVSLTITWGENELSIKFSAYGWTGEGWIGKIGGQDIADQIQRGTLK